MIYHLKTQHSEKTWRSVLVC